MTRLVYHRHREKGILQRIVMRPAAIEPPHIDVSRHSQATDRPRVNVGVVGPSGIMSIFDFPDDEMGNARSEMHARTLSHITGMPIHDRRHPQIHVTRPATAPQTTRPFALFRHWIMPGLGIALAVELAAALLFGGFSR